MYRSIVEVSIPRFTRWLREPLIISYLLVKNSQENILHEIIHEDS